jgi:hypothetical protein
VVYKTFSGPLNSTHMGLEVSTDTPEQFATFIESEIIK